MPESSDDVLAALQVAPDGRVIATGVLVDRDRVLFVGLPEDALTGEIAVEVVLASLPLTARSRVRVYRPIGLDVVRTRGDHDVPPVLVAHLPERAPFRPVLGPFDDDALRSAVAETGGRLVEALRLLGALSEGQPVQLGEDGEQVLAALLRAVRIEAIRPDDTEHPVAYGWCHLIKWPC